MYLTVTIRVRTEVDQLKKSKDEKITKLKLTYSTGTKRKSNLKMKRGVLMGGLTFSLFNY